MTEATVKMEDRGPPPIIKHHLEWIAGYCDVANDLNWRDMLDLIQSQIRMALQDAIDVEQLAARGDSSCT